MSSDRPLLTDLRPLPGPVPGEAGLFFAGWDEAQLAALAPARGFLESVFAHAPYLGRLAQRRRETVLGLTAGPVSTVVDRAIADAFAAAQNAPDIAAFDTALRRAKADMHLAVGLGDLAGALPLSQVTGAVTRFADAAVSAALYAQVRFNAALGRCAEPVSLDNPLPGLFVLALGKMGGGELNYSSDIDLVVLFDAEAIDLPEGQEMRKRLPRLIQAMAKSLQEVTAEGYVFRTDLRLRPDPGATPVALSTDAAFHYYETLGMTWERAAWIKARPSAGDVEAGQRYIEAMQPFIWRRALDYAAIDDIRSLARQIQTVGRRAEIRPAGHDLKLGQGGIREIEFFVQVPQLVMGGRNREVRTPATRDALAALTTAGAVEAPIAQALVQDYIRLRQWEHRIQMRQDEASQTVPEDDAARASLAALSGFETRAEFEAEIEAVLTRVHGHFSDQFEQDKPLASQAGSLVLTGVEPTPDTLTTLTHLGFAEPDRIWFRLNGWAAGKIRALRTDRARRLFAQWAPQLVDTLAETGEPDAAFARFSAFFEGLPMGVQPLSLLMNEPGLAADLIGILLLAPRMASDLARRPELIDAMLDQRFAIPVDSDPPGAFRQRLLEASPDGMAFEDVLNQVRRSVREERLRVGTQILRGTIEAATAGLAFSDMADACIERLAAACLAEAERRYGEAPGRWAVIGLGKLGGRELSADSDLDIMVVHDAPVEAQTWFTRFTQRLVSALSVPTEEGELYQVDMQLRPSGKAGPVAVQFSRFESYYGGEAWTWERMALTRSRMIAGDPGLSDRICAAIEAVLLEAGEAATIITDARDMRTRLEEAKPARSPWDLKARIGGIQDIEFIAQTLQLVHADKLGQAQASTAAALTALAEAEVIAPADAQVLVDSLTLYLSLSQLLRVAHGSGFDPDRASKGAIGALCQACSSPDLDSLKADLDARAERVRALFERYIHLPE